MDAHDPREGAANPEMTTGSAEDPGGDTLVAAPVGIDDGDGVNTRSAMWMVGSLAMVVALVMTFVISRGGSAADGGFDPYLFGEMGRSLARGEGFGLEGADSLLPRRAPLYPLFVGAIFWVFGDHARIVLFAQCILFAATAMLAFDLGRRHFNLRTGVLAGVICTFHPLLLRYVPTLHLETLLTFLFTLMVWCAYRFSKQPTVSNGVLVGITAGLTTLTKAVALLYPAVLAVAVLLAVRAARRRGVDVTTPWKAFVVMGLSMVATIAPWTIRNYVVSDHLVVVSTGTSDAFLRGAIFSRLEYATLREPPYWLAENESNAYFEELSRDAGAVWEQDAYETDQILNAEAKRVLREEPGVVVRKSVVGMFTFWYQLTSLKNSLLALGCAIGMWALAIVGWRRARRLGIEVWPFMLPVLYLNVSLALLLALGRYSAPILPAMAVVSAFGADALLSRFRGSRQEPADA